jgi:hypothetical protein
MAKSKQQPGEPGEVKAGGKSFRPDTSKFRTMKPGETFTGIFVSAGHTEIMDRRTKQRKSLFVLRIRDEESDRVEKFPCAAMMLRAWEDITDEYGGGDPDATISALRGKHISIERGDDAKTADSNPMGTYTVTVFDD